MKWSAPATLNGKQWRPRSVTRAARAAGATDAAAEVNPIPLAACPRCGAAIGQRCQSTSPNYPGPLQIVHRERRTARLLLPDQLIEALDWG